MGRLGGLNYRKVIKKLKKPVSVFTDRQQNREKIEELKDKLDIKLASKVLKSKEKSISFDIKNYV